MTVSLKRGVPIFSNLLRENVVRPKLHTALQLRHYAATRAPPSFDSGGGRASNPEEVFRGLKKKYPKAPNSKQYEDPTPRTGLRKYGITPLRAAIALLLSYLGYEYYKFRNKWNERSSVMNGRWFTPFLLESKDLVSSTCSIFNLRSVPAGQISTNIEDAWRLGVWSVQALKPDIQVARSYSPLPPNDETTAEQVRLLIRKEQDGMVSTYLHRQPPSGVIQLRGPHPEYVIPDDVDEVLFLAGGTGIAPALQVAHCLYNIREMPADRKPKIDVLWANRRREDSFAGFNPTPTENLRTSILAKIQAGWDYRKPDSSITNVNASTDNSTLHDPPKQSPLVQEVEAMRTKHGDKFNVEYFVDEDKTFISEQILRRYLSRDGLGEAPKSDPPGKKLVIIAGPDGFVNAYAGPKGMLKGRATQGPIGGVLERIGYGDWDIWKL